MAHATTVSVKPLPSQHAAQSRRALRPSRSLIVYAQASEAPCVDRRAAIALVVGIPTLLTAPAALAVDPKAAAEAREARKAALKAAAEDMRVTGKAENAFPESQYSEEGVKTTRGA